MMAVDTSLKNNQMIDDIKQTEERERKGRGQGQYLLFFIFPWRMYRLFFTFTTMFLSWRTYLTLGRLRISSLDPSEAECLLQRRWMWLKTTKSWWDGVCTVNVQILHVRLCVLTVRQRLNLLPKTFEIRVFQSVFSWYPLLSLKLETQRQRREIKRGALAL